MIYNLHVLQKMIRKNDSVIENNISTVDRKAKKDHKFKSEGQGHKFSLFQTFRKNGNFCFRFLLFV